jgi:hypothetical protein
MNCIEFEIAVEMAVEQRQPLDSALLEHAQSCPECQQVWEMHQGLESALTVWRFAEAPAGLADAVLRDLGRPELTESSEIPLVSLPRTSSTVRTAKSNRSSSVAILAMSACLMIAAVFVVRASRQGSVDLAQQKLRSNDSTAAVDLPGTLTEVLSELKSEYSGMAVETTTAAREMVNAIPRPETVAMLPDADEFPLNEASSEMTRILKPIGTQVGSALGFLWQAVPSEIPSG